MRAVNLWATGSDSVGRPMRPRPEGLHPRARAAAKLVRDRLDLTSWRCCTISGATATLLGMLVTRSLLAHDLEALGLGPGGAAMVHCRMSALGHVVGGAETVVRALLDTLGPEGTLMAYTGWQDEPPDDLDALDEETSAPTSKSTLPTTRASPSPAASTDASPRR